MASLRALVSGYGPRVHVVEITVPADELPIVRVLEQSSPAGEHPSYIAYAVTAGGAPRVYAVDELKPMGAVAAYAADPSTGALACAGPFVPSAGADPCHVCVHPRGHALYVSNYSGGGISVHALDASTGELHAAPLQVFEPGAHAHHVVLNSGGTRAFIAVLGSDAIFEYIVAADGTLSEAAPAVRLPPGSGPRHLALCEARGFAVSINELDCTLSLLQLDMSASGSANALTLVATVSSLPPGTARAAGFSTAHVAISPDGRFVYGSNRGHNSIGVWRAIDLLESSAGSGGVRLEPVEWQGGGGRTWDAAGTELSSSCPAARLTPALSKPRDFSLSPDAGARFLLCASQLSDTLTLFERDAATGALRAVAGATLPAGAAPTCVIFPSWL